MTFVGNLFWLGESCSVIWEPSGRGGIAMRMIFGYLKFSMRSDLLAEV